MKEILIFTDGASRGNPGPGGWGAIVIVGNNVKELGGGEKNTTNNRMELTAAIEALEYISKQKITHKAKAITLNTDSSYVLKGATAWLPNWKKNGWKTKAKENVLNVDLWERMSILVADEKISWNLLPGHSGIVGNERCDEIATTFACGDVPKLYSGILSKYLIDISNIKINKVSPKKKKLPSNTKAYSYVSMVSGVVYTHASWAECEARVKGKSKARFKKVFSAKDEEALITLWKKGYRS